MARRSRMRTLARSSIISPRPTEIRSKLNLRAHRRDRAPVLPLGTGRGCHNFAASNDRETGKKGKMRRDNDVFREIPTSFKLSSLLHTAYRAPFGHGRFAGTGGSLLFFDPAETTGWLKVL